MSAKFICDGEKYDFYEGTRTITLPVSVENLPNSIEAEGQTLVLKSSFHVSLVCLGKIMEKQTIAILDFEKKIVADFCEFVQSVDISLVRHRNEFKFVEEKDRKSVIVMCDVSNLESFFKHINQKYALQLEIPPTHVTLYTLQSDVGIFVTDSRDVKLLTKPVVVPELVYALDGLSKETVSY